MVLITKKRVKLKLFRVNMSQDLETTVDHSDNDDEKYSDQLSQLSASPQRIPSPEIESLERAVEEQLQINDDQNDDDDLTKFIRQARQEGFNCLDLSKKSIELFPKILLDFPCLQVNLIGSIEFSTIILLV